MPLVEVGEAGERAGEPELLQGRRLRRDGAEDGVDPALLPVGVAAEPAHAGQGVGEVHLPAVAQGRLLLGVEDLADQPLRRPRRERLAVEIGRSGR